MGAPVSSSRSTPRSVRVSTAARSNAAVGVSLLPGELPPAAPIRPDKPGLGTGQDRRAGYTPSPVASGEHCQAGTIPDRDDAGGYAARQLGELFAGFDV